jgi:hypothetical protein
MGFLAPAARAEFSMQIVNNTTGDGFKIQENQTHTGFSLTPLGSENAGEVTWSANSGAITAKATIDGYTFNVTSKSNQDTTPTPKMGDISFSGSVTTNPGAAPAGFSIYASDSPVPSLGNPTLYASGVASSKNWNPGDLLLVRTQYTEFGTQTYQTNPTGPLNGSNQSINSNVATISSTGGAYALTDVGQMYLNGHVGTSRFWVSSATAMPEPTGIMIGLLGIPCVGGLVLLSRLRAAKAAAAAAA